jgi:hypothetical protein
MLDTTYYVSITEKQEFMPNSEDLKRRGKLWALDESSQNPSSLRNLTITSGTAMIGASNTLNG